MKRLTVANIVLLLLIALGFFSALMLSIDNLQGKSCSHIGPVPVCYVVLVAYGLMLASVLIRHAGCRHHFFATGWAVAFIVAVAGSVAEVAAGGGVCPTSGGSLRGVISEPVPMCYVSLAMLIVILLMFLLGPYKRTCSQFNASQG